MGDPEASFSLSRMLEAMLHAAYPQQRFEVVNAAITAINSHLRPRHCGRLWPQLETGPLSLSFSEGNNEVTSGRSVRPACSRRFRAPKRASAPRLLLAQAHPHGAMAGLPGESVAPRCGRMGAGWRCSCSSRSALMIRGSDAVRTNFRAKSPGDRRGRSEWAGATTLMCTVLTKSSATSAPFLSQHRPGLTAAELAEWQLRYDTAVKMQQAGRSFSPPKPLIARPARWTIAMRNWFSVLAGSHCSGRTRWRCPRSAPAGAGSRPTPRFRTESRLNQSIRDLSHPQAQVPPVEVVDLAAALAARSAHGITGDDLLYEHVHLTFSRYVRGGPGNCFPPWSPV